MHRVARVRGWLLLGGCLAANVAFQRQNPPAWSDNQVLDNPPPAAAVRAAAWGENALAGYLVMLYLQNFDVHLGLWTPLADLDRTVLIRWLDLATALDPDSGYPYLLATRHYAETGTPEQRRMILDWVYHRFEERPNQRWEWLAHGVFVARHVLKDDGLAEQYAAALRTRVTDPAVPSWVRQMDLLLKADRGAAADARAILGGLIAAGQIRSAAELKFLESRLPPQSNIP
jgi:hypothetical protein